MDRRAALVDLLGRTAAAHHRAYIETDGFDPAWPTWYAEHMRSELEDLMQRSLEVEWVAATLVSLDEEHRREAPERDWREMYADRLLEK